MLPIILTSVVAQIILFILGLVFLVASISALFSEDNFIKWLSIPSLVIAILSFVGFFFGQTHRFVKANEVMVVIDKKNGQPILPVRTSGVTSVPLWRSNQYTYPAQTVYQWCPQFTPSSKGGTSLITDVCFTADASKIDWVTQFKAFNGNLDTITKGWQNAIQTNVASAISVYNPRDLTDRRLDVEQAIYSLTIVWFKDNGIPITMVSLKNWNFANAEVNKAYDEALLSQTQIDIANAQQEAAKIRADTQVIVAQKLADGQRLACQTAGMDSETSCLQYLELIWLSSSQNISNINVITGANGNIPVSIPIQPVQTEVVSSPTPTP